jgi:curved DNA-binding protein CbpA
MADSYDPKRDLYVLLNLEPTATPHELRRAYRAAMKRAHPDVNRDSRAKTAAQALNEAKRVLLDAERREEYDAARQRWTSKASEKIRRHVAQQSVPRAGSSGPSTRVARPPTPKTLADSAEELARALGVKPPNELAVWRIVASAIDAASRRPPRPSVRKMAWRPGVTGRGAAVCYRTTARPRGR